MSNWYGRSLIETIGRTVATLPLFRTRSRMQDLAAVWSCVRGFVRRGGSGGGARRSVTNNRRRTLPGEVVTGSLVEIDRPRADARRGRSLSTQLPPDPAHVIGALLTGVGGSIHCHEPHRDLVLTHNASPGECLIKNPCRIHSAVVVELRTGQIENIRDARCQLELLYFPRRLEQGCHCHGEILAVTTLQVPCCLRHLDRVDAVLQVPIDAAEVISIDDLGHAAGEFPPLCVGGDLQSTVIP